MIDEGARREQTIPSTARIARALVASILAAELTAALALPWAHPGGLLVATVLLWPACGAVCIALSWTFRPGKTAPARTAVQRVAVTAATAVFVFSFGLWLANLALIDEPLKPHMLAAYGVSAIVALAFAGLLWHESRLDGRFAGLVHAMRLERVALAHAVLFATYDALCLSEGYWGVHVILLALTLSSACAASFFWRGGAPRPALALAGLLVALLATAPTVLRGGRQAAYDAMLRAPTSHQRVLLLARQLTDRDGDGFSAQLGGGDCDDADRSAYPLSTRGRDCLGWVDAASRAPRATPAGGGEMAGPTTIVLLTIDTFRCGFGDTEIPELLDACPNLTAMKRDGQLRLHGYTSYPATSYAFDALHTLVAGEPGENDLMLARWFADHGYETRALAVPPQTIAGPIAASFQSIDRTWEEQAGPATCFAEVVTDRVLTALGTRQQGAKPLFLWAHYFDPHGPYVAEPGSLLATEPALRRYVAEIRRTDAAIGRLVKELRALPDARDLFVLLTADHGESLGEKGHYYHGSAIDEPAVRVPMLAWSPDAKWTRQSARELPSSIVEVGPYLTAVAESRPFRSTGEAFFQVRVRWGHMYGLVRDGWKLTHHQVFGRTELYHVAADPFEERDLARQEPHKVRELQRRLAAHLTAAHGAVADGRDRAD